VPEASNVGSASHMGEKQVPRDAHFAYDYTYRRVPIPVTAYMGIADSGAEPSGTENMAKKALELVRSAIEPAVIAEEELNRVYMERLIRESIAGVGKSLFEETARKGTGEPAAVSLTVAVTDKRKAYIGHVGTGRIYLLHMERLYDLTPTGSPATPAPSEPSPPSASAPPEAVMTQEPAPPATVSTSGEIPPSQSLQGGEVAPPPAPLAGPSTPEQPGAPRVTEEPPTLFDVPGGAPAGGAGESQFSLPGASGGLLGQSTEAMIGYNEVEIVPGDVLILCTDGMWKTVNEEEMVESLTTSPNMQRSASQLSRLAFSRDVNENASVISWQYVTPGYMPAGKEREARGAERRSKAFDVLLVALLSLVLIGLFGFGFAFGWRIADAFRKPQKEAAQAKRQAAARQAAEKIRKEQEAAKAKQESQKAAAPKQTASVKGDGVRMRSAPDAHATIVGLLVAGQTMTVLQSVTGADGKTWYKCGANVTSSGKDVVAEGFVRNDFLVMNPAPAPAPATTP
jgi:serine/threonine protein phosphatase PrpC